MRNLALIRPTLRAAASAAVRDDNLRTNVSNLARTGTATLGGSNSSTELTETLTLGTRYASVLVVMFRLDPLRCLLRTCESLLTGVSPEWSAWAVRSSGQSGQPAGYGSDAWPLRPHETPAPDVDIFCGGAHAGDRDLASSWPYESRLLLDLRPDRGHRVTAPSAPGIGRV